MTTYSSLFTEHNKRIPSILSIGVVAVVSFFAWQFAFSQPQKTQAFRVGLKKAEVTNISSTQATIVWQTDEKETGWILYGTSPDNLSSNALDIRDTEGQKNSHHIHLANLVNLQPNTNYVFSITDGSKILEQNNKHIFSFKTPSKDNRVNNLKPAYGKIISSNGEAVEGALVTIAFDNAVKLTTLSKNSGEWLIPLNLIIDKNKLILKTPSDNEQVHMLIEDDNGQLSRVTGKLTSFQPVSETLTIGKNYDLNHTNQVLSASTSTKTPPQKQPYIFEVLYPKNKSTIPIGAPLIKGTGVPNTRISILVTGNGKQFKDSQIVNKDGVWKAQIESELLAATYTLNAVSEDSRTQPITRIFTITKSGEQVLGEATASATLTPTPSPTISPTTIATIQPTAITPTLPSSGGNIQNIAISSVAFLVLGAGLMIIF